MGFCDHTDEEIFALTRARRRELAERRARPQPVRFAALCVETVEAIPCVPATGRDREAANAWRNAQWRAGNRACSYCIHTLAAVRPGPAPHNMATVDHREPVATGGDDAAWNWTMACYLCNQIKGKMPEAEYLARPFAPHRGHVAHLVHGTRPGPD